MKKIIQRSTALWFAILTFSTPAWSSNSNKNRLSYTFAGKKNAISVSWKRSDDVVWIYSDIIEDYTPVRRLTIHFPFEVSFRSATNGGKLTFQKNTVHSVSNILAIDLPFFENNTRVSVLRDRRVETLQVDIHPRNQYQILKHYSCQDEGVDITKKISEQTAFSNYPIAVTCTNENKRIVLKVQHDPAMKMRIEYGKGHQLYSKHKVSEYSIEKAYVKNVNGRIGSFNLINNLFQSSPLYIIELNHSFQSNFAKTASLSLANNSYSEGSIELNQLDLQVDLGVSYSFYPSTFFLDLNGYSSILSLIRNEEDRRSALFYGINFVAGMKIFKDFQLFAGYFFWGMNVVNGDFGSTGWGIDYLTGPQLGAEWKYESVSLKTFYSIMNSNFTEVESRNYATGLDFKYHLDVNKNFLPSYLITKLKHIDFTDVSQQRRMVFTSILGGYGFSF